MEPFIARQREQLHELAFDLTDVARRLSGLSPRTGLPDPAALSTVLIGLTDLQQNALGHAGDIDQTAGLSPETALPYQRAVQSEAFVGTMIGMATVLASVALLTTVKATAQGHKDSGPNESAPAYLHLLESQNLLIAAAGGLRELARHLTCEESTALDELAAALGTSSRLRDWAAPAGR